MSVLVYDTFEAALLVYDNRWLTQVDYDQNGQNTFHFEMQPWSYDELHAAYISDEGQGITNLREYANAFKRVERLKGLAKRSRDGNWVDKAWQNGQRNREEEK
jgi:hypothetical protein